MAGDQQTGTDRIVRDPAILGGTPVIRGTRIPPHALLERVRDGDTVDDILAEYPQLDRGTVDAALIYAEAHPMQDRPKGQRLTAPPSIRPSSP